MSFWVISIKKIRTYLTKPMQIFKRNKMYTIKKNLKLYKVEKGE